MWSRLLITRLAGSTAKVGRCNYMKGPKGREGQNKKPHSLTIEGLKKHWDLIPLFTVMTIAMSGVVLYVGRLCTKTPDVSWRKVENPSDDYKDRSSKLWSTHSADLDHTVVPVELKSSYGFKGFK